MVNNDRTGPGLTQNDGRTWRNACASDSRYKLAAVPSTANIHEVRPAAETSTGKAVR
jgi:hypothetical protein